MTFNFKKNAQKIQNSVLPISKGLQNNEDKYSLSLNNRDFIPNFNTILEKDRRPIEGKIVTHEAMLDEKRKKAVVQDKVTEGALQDSESPLYPHRQFKDGEDSYLVSPIAALSQANDRKFRDAYSKANKDSDTEFWDKYVGDQLDSPLTKVPTNITDKGSQLQNNPERFGKNKNLPINPSAIINRDNFGAGVDVSPMIGSAKGKKGLKMSLSSLKEADGLLFGIYLKAAKENRILNNDEQDLIYGINRDKKDILLSLAQFVPPSKPDVPVSDENLDKEIRNSDFLDGSPIDRGDLGDSQYWPSQSGFDADSLNLNKDTVGNTNFEEPSQLENPTQDPSFDNGEFPGVQDPNDPNGVINTGSEFPINQVKDGIAPTPKANNVEETPF